MKFQNTDFCVETIHFIIKRDPKEYKKVTKTHNLQGSSKTKRKISLYSTCYKHPVLFRPYQNKRF